MVEASMIGAIYRNAPIDDADLIDGTTVDGDFAAGSVDVHRFEGDIDDIRLLG